MIDPKEELTDEKDVINAFFEYITDQGRGTYEFVHSPLGTWLHIDDPDEVRISGWAEPGKAIEDRSLAYPTTVGEVACLVLQIEDASRMVSRDPDDPYYEEEENDYLHDQERYRFKWDEQRDYLDHEMPTAMLNFHNNYSKLLNGEVW